MGGVSGGRTRPSRLIPPMINSHWHGNPRTGTQTSYDAMALSYVPTASNLQLNSKNYISSPTPLSARAQPSSI
jgi:hypothetical protein